MTNKKGETHEGFDVALGLASGGSYINHGSNIILDATNWGFSSKHHLDQDQNWMSKKLGENAVYSKVQLEHVLF